MTFGQAIYAAVAGKRVAREGWNGKGMWVAYSPGCEALPASSFWSPANAEYAAAIGGSARVRPCMTMKLADGSIMMGWTPSGMDVLAEDWGTV